MIINIKKEEIIMKNKLILAFERLDYMCQHGFISHFLDVYDENHNNEKDIEPFLDGVLKYLQNMINNGYNKNDKGYPLLLSIKNHVEDIVTDELHKYLENEMIDEDEVEHGYMTMWLKDSDETIWRITKNSITNEHQLITNIFDEIINSECDQEINIALFSYIITDI